MKVNLNKAKELEQAIDKHLNRRDMGETKEDFERSGATVVWVEIKEIKSTKPEDIKKEVRQLLVDFYTPEEIDIFMDSPHPQMDEGTKTPNQAIDIGYGDQVLQTIRRMSEGVYL